MRFAALLLLVAAMFVMPICALAQIAPPAPGVEIPQAYYDRISQDRTAFQFQNAWIQKAQRAKKARQEFFADLKNNPGPETRMSMASLPDAVRARISVAGTVRVPVIVIEYSNVAAPFPAAQVQSQIFDGPTTSVGTLTQLYTEMSYGALTMTGDVLGWVTGTGTDVFYEGGSNGLGGTAKTGQLILEALQGVDGAVDFGLYDNDGPDGIPNSGDDDGLVDFISIVHPETGGECGGSNMWSHRWVVQGWAEFPGPWVTNDARTGGGNILVSDYTIQPVKGSVTGCGAGINEIGVFAHEFGHAFGLPDFYDTNGGGEGIGELGLMGSGNWQNPPAPTHMSAFSKQELGWITAQEVGPVVQNYNIAAIEINANLYRANIYEEKFSRSALNPISGAVSFHCGLPLFAANNRNWAGGAGYGNGWGERVQRTFSYDGVTHPVTFQYDVSYDTEATYDFGRVIIEVNGTETILAAYDGIGSAVGVVHDVTPQLSGSGASSYRVILEMTSDVAWSDEDGSYNSGAGGPFKVDNVSLNGGGVSYFSDFEQYEDGWCYAVLPREYFLIENRKKNEGVFDLHLNAEGLHIWHVDEGVADNTQGSTTTANLRPARLAAEQADGLNHLALGVNRGDAGDAFPGSSGNANFNDTTTPNSKSNNAFATNVAVTNISALASTMTADMRGGRFAPTVTSIVPNSGDNNLVVSVTEMLGTLMYKGGTFCLTDGVTQYPASNVGWIGKAKVTGDLDLNGVPGGVYDVLWKGLDGQEAKLVQGFTVNAVATGIGDTPAALVNALNQNYPNPFNPTTTINYTIKNRNHVTLRIYNAAGQLVRTLVNDFQAPRAGGFSPVWNGLSDAGNRVASGVYVYKLAIGNEFQQTRKLVLLK